jgi:hypothetical protein
MAKNLTAAKTGDRKEALEVLRDTLAEQIDTTEANVHAQLSAQYRAVLVELAEIAAPVSKPKGSVDELKQRRQDRRATPDASANA